MYIGYLFFFVVNYSKGWTLKRHGNYNTVASYLLLGLIIAVYLIYLLIKGLYQKVSK